jgi:hypothetical protein
MSEVRFDTREVDAMLRNMKRRFPDIVSRAMLDTAEWGAKQIPPLYLKGPRPDNLVSDPGRGTTGRLARGIAGDVVATEKTTGVIYVKNHVKSPRGFDYPSYWEYRGTRHGGPRPFLKPFLQEQWRKISTMFRGHFVRQFRRQLR